MRLASPFDYQYKDRIVTPNIEPYTRHTRLTGTQRNIQSFALGLPREIVHHSLNDAE